MPDKNDATPEAIDLNTAETKKRIEALALAIRDEMGSLTQEELELLYVAVLFMQQNSKCNYPKFNSKPQPLSIS